MRVSAFRIRLLGDRIFNLTTLVLTLVGLSILVGLAIALVVESTPSLKAFGWGFVFSTDWDPVNERCYRGYDYQRKHFLHEDAEANAYLFREPRKPWSLTA